MHFAMKNYCFQESDGQITLELILSEPVGFITKLNLECGDGNATEGK